MRASWLLVLAACGGFVDREAASTTYRIVHASMDAARRERDVELARSALPSGIVQLDALVLAYPHRGFEELRADATCQYAFAFVFDDWEDARLAGRADDAERIAARLTGLLRDCSDANLALLPPAWRGDVSAHAREATAADVPAVRRIATAGALAIAIDPVRGLGKLDGVMTMLARCVELAPLAHDGDAELVLGTLEAARSMFLGGPDGSARFAAARELGDGGVLAVDVTFARAVAVARHDRAAFEAALHRVLAADLERWPDRRLQNELARRRARRYLAAEATLFQ
ncbi:MAG TPA: TRAP transporter TatT component family protein [Kofleriaceae bacterium]|nr:TRAP transporter TatT component family protein [Kofleriaceae bacterium]